MDKDLCCQINPVESCTGCGKKMCDQHLKYIRRVEKMLWCMSCSDAHGDYIDFLGEFAEKNKELRYAVEEAVTAIYDVAGHATHCRDCRGESSCDDLYRRIASAEQEASYIERNLRRI